MIELSGLDVYYGADKVLDAITFEAKKGIFVGIIGPNGSGKTTLLKAIEPGGPTLGRDHPSRRPAACGPFQPRSCSIGRGRPAGNKHRL